MVRRVVALAAVADSPVLAAGAVKTISFLNRARSKSVNDLVAVASVVRVVRRALLVDSLAAVTAVASRAGILETPRQSSKTRFSRFAASEF